VSGFFVGRKAYSIMNDQSKESIRAHLEVILQQREGDLAAAIRGLDALKSSTGGHLAHYLGKRSYQKAWILLQGENPEKGTCG
jgi:hypothetical protein